MRPSINASRNGADRQTAALRHMTVDQLLDLGRARWVYLRGGTCDGERALWGRRRALDDSR